MQTKAENKSVHYRKKLDAAEKKLEEAENGWWAQYHRAEAAEDRGQTRRRLQLEMAFPRFTTRDPFEFPSSAFLDSRSSFLPSACGRESVFTRHGVFHLITYARAASQEEAMTTSDRPTDRPLKKF